MPAPDTVKAYCLACKWRGPRDPGECHPPAVPAAIGPDTYWDKGQPVHLTLVMAEQNAGNDCAHYQRRGGK